ncbi:MAG: hypothetical protein H0Z38_01060 [Firmicutes bacterium]|nr:hypothetical protein [Bacillota bacterium]
MFRYMSARTVGDIPAQAGFLTSQSFRRVLELADFQPAPEEITGNRYLLSLIRRHEYVSISS